MEIIDVAIFPIQAKLYFFNCCGEIQIYTWTNKSRMNSFTACKKRRDTDHSAKQKERVQSNLHHQNTFPPPVWSSGEQQSKLIVPVKILHHDVTEKVARWAQLFYNVSQKI